ncbi:MucBP domain-containing protein [Clostridium estertheticum]|uniref:MucBP domain-containing protein n=1 Tax=Clostridium estertheticum TaxID=238834 RepID=A0AA47EHM4_9CLOT|nr:MucBP domain-containing protein [Clostridium estertheticum]MBU3155318.1 MucBP domain-containing protein [Clostridium estertheticum]MBU3197746.1 MucBP domain-containing protein [Clostridium estertheticum]WAG60376.1 MucBP domain-containing protein [Clostridium estertheticum]WAG65548.1 MucBP domain-containing protein [Clostridium estertheticum]
MNKLKGFLALILMLTMGSISGGAVELDKYSVPDFSIMIGTKLYTLDYANDQKKEMEITKAITENVGDIYIKTTGSEWTNNSSGKVVEVSIINKLEVKTFNGVDVVAPPTQGTEGSIVFKAVDVDTDLQLMDSVSRKGKVGSECVGYISVIEGYDFVLADTTFTGKFTNLDQIVTLKYRKKKIVVNNPPSTKITGLTAGLTFKQGERIYMLVEAVDEDKETTNVRVDVDGSQVGNSDARCYVLLNTETLGGHIVRINSRDKQGVEGEQQTLTYLVR